MGWEKSLGIHWKWSVGKLWISARKNQDWGHMSGCHLFWGYNKRHENGQIGKTEQKEEKAQERSLRKYHLKSRMKNQERCLYQKPQQEERGFQKGQMLLRDEEGYGLRRAWAVRKPEVTTGEQCVCGKSAWKWLQGVENEWKVEGKHSWV